MLFYEAVKTTAHVMCKNNKWFHTQNRTIPVVDANKKFTQNFGRVTPKGEANCWRGSRFVWRRQIGSYELFSASGCMPTRKIILKWNLKERSVDLAHLSLDIAKGPSVVYTIINLQAAYKQKTHTLGVWVFSFRCSAKAVL